MCTVQFSQPNTMQPQEVVDAGLFIAEWSKCLTAKYQRDQLYRFGKFDDCSRQWNDLKNAAYAKFCDESAARKIMEATYHHKRSTISPTIGVIWEAKDKPGWS
jgi:Protein of unknown function (DUF3128)